MYTCEGLLDMLNRCHRSFRGLLEHCRELEAGSLAQELEGFGFPTIQQQFHHVIAAQRYWVGVIEGRMDVQDDGDEFPTVDALEEFRQRIHELTAAHLRGTTDPALNEPRTMITWGNHEKTLMPAHVILRTLTHMFQHQGQISAMCRLLGKPIPAGLDFPMVDSASPR